MTRTAAALLLFCCAELAAFEPPQLGLGSARVFTPATVQFDVANVNVTTLATAPTTISFDLAVLNLGEAIRISVRADGDLTIPGGAAIPASNISWTTTNPMNGIGMNGTVSKTVYTPVFESIVGATDARIDLNWQLAPAGAGIRAGTRQAALRWRFEVITP